MEIISGSIWYRLVSKYNAQKHRTIGMRPIDVTLTIADKLLNMVYSSAKAVALSRSGLLGTCEQIQDDL